MDVGPVFRLRMPRLDPGDPPRIPLGDLDVEPIDRCWTWAIQWLNIPTPFP